VVRRFSTSHLQEPSSSSLLSTGRSRASTWYRKVAIGHAPVRGVYQTQDTYKELAPARSATDYITEIVNEQGGRYKSFLTNFSMGFQDTELEMFKWILYPHTLFRGR